MGSSQKSIWLPMMRQSVLENAKEEVRIPKNALELAHTQHGIQKRGGGGLVAPGGNGQEGLPPPAVRRF